MKITNRFHQTVKIDNPVALISFLSNINKVKFSLI